MYGWDPVNLEVKNVDSMEVHWSYKYLIDWDGVGYSRRLMSFLASDSVPLKAAVYEEFYSDWIQLWWAPSRDCSL